MSKRRSGKKKSSYQQGDRYTQKARDEGYAARSVYKLQEIQKRARILQRGQKVVDLGCYPGSWSDYAIKQVGPKGRVVGVDFTAPALPHGVWIAESIYDVTTEQILTALDGHADLMMSDMAPPTTGARDADHYVQIELARRALEVAVAVGKLGSSFVCKVFEGGDARAFQLEAQVHYKVRRIRPDAVRANSREWFLVGTGKKTPPAPWPVE
ncbi:MAG: RlmE family RNA methyltransferase [Proteobacteria bacterium]|nr:RlmE family RNA methyltransferase [Pseudomonadota bacterium]